MDQKQLLDGLIAGFLGFVTIDILLKRNFDKIDWIAERKNDSLKEVIRPLIRKCTFIVNNKQMNLDEKEQLIELYDSIFPAPSLDLKNKIEALNSPLRAQDISALGDIIHELELVKEAYKKFTISYCGYFLNVPKPEGILMYIAIVMNSLNLIWIPFLLVYFILELNGVWTYVLYFLIYFLYS